MGWLSRVFGAKEVKEVGKSTPVVLLESFDLLIDRVSKELGISDLGSRALVKNALKMLAQEYAITTQEEFIQQYEDDGELHQKVINALTVNETYFLRERGSLDWLVRYIEHSSVSLNILSAPCSNGAEVYSILMLLASKDRALLKRVKIVGIDVNSEALAVAKEAIYSKRALHYVDDTMRQSFFEPINDHYRLKCSDEIDIGFYQENIFELDTTKYGTFDVILSRNLFIYFDDATRKRALLTLYGLLRSDGILILGHADFVKTDGLFEKIQGSIYKKI